MASFSYLAMKIHGKWHEIITMEGVMITGLFLARISIDLTPIALRQVDPGPVDLVGEVPWCVRVPTFIHVTCQLVFY